MLNITGGLKVYLAVEPADMRKGFGGLYALASEKMREDPQLVFNHCIAWLTFPSGASIRRW